MKIETRFVAYLALVWATCSLVGLLFAGIAYRRAKDRLWDLEATQIQHDRRIDRVEIKCISEPVAAEHTTK